MPSDGFSEIQRDKNDDWDEAYGSSSSAAAANSKAQRRFLATETSATSSALDRRDAVSASPDDQYYGTVDEDAEASLAEEASKRMFTPQDVAMLLSAAGQMQHFSSKPLTAQQRIHTARVELAIAWDGAEKTSKPAVMHVTNEMIEKAAPQLPKTGGKHFVHKAWLEHSDTHSTPFSMGMRLYGMSETSPHKFVPGVATSDADHDGFTIKLPRASQSNERRLLWVNSSDPNQVQQHGDIDYEGMLNDLEPIPDRKNPGKSLPHVLVSTYSPLADLLLEREAEVAHEADGRLHVVSEEVPFMVVHKANALKVVRRYKSEVLDRIDMTKFEEAGKQSHQQKSGVRVELVRTSTTKHFNQMEKNTPGLTASQAQAAGKWLKTEFTLAFDIVASEE